MFSSPSVTEQVIGEEKPDWDTPISSNRPPLCSMDVKHCGHFALCGFGRIERI